MRPPALLIAAAVFVVLAVLIASFFSPTIAASPITSPVTTAVSGFFALLALVAKK